jgi:hypothetical protein
MPTLDERAKTLTYLHGLGRKDGGYADQIDNARSGLQHTASVCRALRLLDGQLADPRATLAFVHRCFDPRSGGFCERPGARPTVLCTALALIVLRCLQDRGGLAERLRAAVAFLAREAHSAMDHFMVVAAHEEAQLPVPPPLSSLDFFRSGRQPDGTFGDSAFANAIAAATLLRTGQPLDQPAALVRRLLGAQGHDGGFADHAGPADLLTTYAAMRALALLKATPDLAALTRYLAGLARHDGGFGARSDARATAGATYQALAVITGATIELRASASAERGGVRGPVAPPSGRGSRTA